MALRPDLPGDPELKVLSRLPEGMPTDPDDDPTSYPGAQPERALGTKPEDFPSFYVRHRMTMTYVAGRYLADRRDADEVVQEAFLKMFLALPELPTELAALAYARRTVVNLCIDRLRAAGRRPRLIDLDAVPETTLGLVELDDPVVAAEDAVVVREALARLSPLHRQALVMREVEELPLPEIAARLDIPEETVKHVLHRARKALRRFLAGSSVDPAVDIETLSLGQLVAAKPLRVGVLLVVLIAGVLTGQPLVFGHHGATPEPTTAEGARTQLLPSLRDPSAKAPTTRRLTPRVDSPRLAPWNHVTAPTTTDVHAGPAVTPQPPVGSKPTVAPHPTPKPPTKVGSAPSSRPAGPVLTVTGLNGVSGAKVSNETRAASFEGYQSSSRLTANTVQGEFSLNQSFAVADTPTGLVVTGAQANPVLPSAGGAGDGYLLSTDQVTTTPTAQGVEVAFSGLATPLVGDPATPPVVLIVHTVFDPTLTQVLAESVNLGVPIQPPAAPDLVAAPALPPAVLPESPTGASPPQ